MAARLIPIALLLLTGLVAQDVKGKPQDPSSKPAVTPATKANTTKLEQEKQDPAPTAEERKAALEARLAKLRSELKEIQDLKKNGGIVSLIQSKLDDRGLKSRAIVDKNEPKLPIPKPAQDAAQNPGNEAGLTGEGGPDAKAKANKATLLAADQRADLPKGTIMLVNGLPANKAEFDELIAYYKSYPQSLSEDQVRSRAIEALVLVKTAQSRFPEGTRNARGRLLEIQKELAAGKDFAEVAKQRSDCPSKTNGGNLGLFSRHQMDPNFTKESFTTKVGSTTKIFPSAFGFHIIKVNSYERGDTPAEDKVNASHILALYDKDSNKVRQCMNDAMQGRSKIQFVSKDMMKYAPKAYH